MLCTQPPPNTRNRVISNCGPESIKIQEYDCCKSNRNENSESYMGGVKLKEAFSTKYLGEFISSDGTNTDNIAARKKRGFWTGRRYAKC